MRRASIAMSIMAADDAAQPGSAGGKLAVSRTTTLPQCCESEWALVAVQNAAISSHPNWVSNFVFVLYIFKFVPEGSKLKSKRHIVVRYGDKVVFILSFHSKKQRTQNLLSLSLSLCCCGVSFRLRAFLVLRTNLQIQSIFL